MAKEVAKAIIILKGIYQKKHRAAHEEGNLVLLPKSMAYKGSAEAWCQRIATHANLIAEPCNKDPKPTEKVKLLKLHCPKCDVEADSRRMKLKVKAGYCSITCKQCRSIKLSSKWRCSCHKLWPKCGVHVQAKLLEKNIKGSGKRSRGTKRKKNPLGIDAPLPKQRQQFIPEAIAVEGPIAKMQCFLQRGSKHALRFPHLVQAAVPT